MLDTIDEKTRQLENISIETVQNETQRGKN